ncbi:MAG: RNA 3'-terminal phosphate cyclase [Candidatus Diapherotrites archaeon]|nr:RNA 3'-terminal phosphate cyclase [Candidatus Diapherotrites archaeon]
MIEIDGSQGEGGGQVLRTALSLSALTQQPVKVFNIRAGRERPGLQPQHLAGVKTLAEICGAEIKGALPRSATVEFFPKQAKPANFNVNTFTAGAVSLIVQQVLPVSLLQPVKLRIIGGTNVAFSPPMDFLRQSLFPALRKMGAKAEAEIIKRGFFPRGGGIVSFSSRRAKLPLQPIRIVELGELELIEIFSASASLPTAVAQNQASGAKHMLRHFGVEFKECLDCAEKSSSIGSSVSVFAHYGSGAVLSGSALGAKGKPAEQVGVEAGRLLLREIDAGLPCGSHLADQLIPFMALAEGKSEIRCTALTRHCLTNIAVVEKFLPVKFSVEGAEGKPAKISVEGAAFAGQ